MSTRRRVALRASPRWSLASPSSFPAAEARICLKSVSYDWNSVALSIGRNGEETKGRAARAVIILLFMTATTVTTLAGVLSSLAQVQANEKAVSAELAALVASHDNINASLDRLKALGPALDELLVDADLLQNKVLATATTADRVGGRVRTLDEEMRRIRDATDRVAQVTDLKVALTAHPSTPAYHLQELACRPIRRHRPR